MVSKKKVVATQLDETQDFEEQLEREGFDVEQDEEVSEAGEADSAEGDHLTKALLEAQEEVQQANDKMLRLAAEFENYKKRMERERSSALKYAGESLIRDLLPTVDNLERAIAQGKNSGEAGPLFEGVEMTLKLLLGTLEKYELKPVEGVGEPFDPNFHEALATEATDSVPVNHIVQEYERGYLYKDRLIRAAKVVVAKEVEDPKE